MKRFIEKHGHPIWYILYAFAVLWCVAVIALAVSATIMVWP